MRPSGRAADSLRPVTLEPGVAKHAEGSCLVKFGDTHVLCTATVEDKPPLLSAQHRSRLGDRGIRHAAARDAYADAARGQERPVRTELKRSSG